MRCFLAGIFLLVLAGCAANPPQDPQEPAGDGAGTQERPALVDPTFRTPLLLGDVPRALAEPNLALGPDGALVVTTPLFLWRSHDGGTSFEAVGEPACDTDVALAVCPPGFTGLHPHGLVGNGDGDIAFDADGTLWWAGLNAAEAAVPVQSSTDQGTTWGAAVDAADGEHGDREWIDVDGNGTIRLVWTQFDGALPYTVYRRLEHGNLSATVHLPGSNRLKGPLVRAADGALHVPQVDWNGIWLATSHDDGATWNDTLVADISSYRGVYQGSPAWIFPIAAIDSGGTLYVTWSTDTPMDGVRPARDLAAPSVHLASSRDGGATWTDTVLSTPLHAAIFPWVVAGSPGRVAVAWYESASPAASETLPSTWDVRLLTSVDADSPTPSFAGGKANKDPVHIGYVCTSGGGCMGRDRTRGDFFEVALGDDGLPIVAWAGDSPTLLQHVQVWFGGVATGTALRDVGPPTREGHDL